MAVASMHRFVLYGLRRDLPSFLSVLQEMAVTEIEPPTEMEEEATPWAGQAVEALEREIGELERAVAFCERFAPRRPNFIEQFAGVKTVLAEEEFRAYAHDEASLRKILARLKEIEAEHARLGAELHERRGLLAQLEPWRGLGLTRSELEGTRHVAVILGLVPPKAVEGLKAALRGEPRAVLRVVSADEREARLVIFWPREAELGVLLGDLPFVQTSPPAFAGRLEEAVAEEEAACARRTFSTCLSGTQPPRPKERLPARSFSAALNFASSLRRWSRRASIRGRSTARRPASVANEASASSSRAQAASSSGTASSKRPAQAGGEVWTKGRSPKR
ncbi:MAG: hypothetical protein GX493_02835, partial [Firmicutes bacterium]|nr:hypothetical protein [Bacillota bacterium]